MKPNFLIALFLFIVIGVSCQKAGPDPRLSELKGTWVRVDKPDTIAFGWKGYDDWFELRRGYKLYDDGIYRPVIPFGPFTYKLQDSIISMQWQASSCFCWPKYYFSIRGSEIEMGNFIDGTPPKIILKKIE